MAPAEAPSGAPPSTPHVTTVCFTTQDLAQFSAASGDRNPLHLSEEYARATPYGERVVFGLLGVLAALGHLADRQDRLLQRLSVEFRNPLSVGIPYRLEALETSAERACVKLYDVTRLMLKATFTFVPGYKKTRETRVPEAACFTEAEDRKKEDLPAGTRVTGVYGPATSELVQLITQWRLSEKGATTRQLAAMLWASFVVGMKLPGKRAVFWRLELTFHPEDEPQNTLLSYDVAVQDFDERFDLLHSAGTLSAAGTRCATADMWAFVRQDSPQPSLRRLTALIPSSDRLKGKVALVIGGSRGLGAAITQALALQGCAVVLNYRQCKAEAEKIRASLGDTSSLIELAQGDASEIEWCRTLRQRIVEQYGGLDLLIGNASPPIRPLSFVPEKLAQFQKFLAQSVALASMPISTFLHDLSERSGWNVLVSSAFVIDRPAEWPHYVTAKCAIEGLAQWAAVHSPKVHTLIVRPPKLLTDQTNTTVGRQGAMEVERAAAAIVTRIAYPGSAPTGEILETFELNPEASR
ncbi:MAG: SDR family NAD(P)-dependent oxidoreductase [Nitrospira sp.]|nr:SDR family NAD(P)-dependent oxidoreductase [Nitrospira sp.]